MLEVQLLLRATDAQVVQPVALIGPSSITQASARTNIPAESRNCVILSVPEIQLQLRMHDYYMGAP
jgi:hypothetical protein